ncbi:MAG: aldehyde ferredoxin oxidoreductase N-terminal domain-containing protein, partial [Eubacteriales bacterium]
MLGYAGKFLNVDLSSGNSWVEALDDKVLEQFVGGRGLGGKLLYDKLPPGVDPLSPHNVILVLTGPVTGAPVTN